MTHSLEYAWKLDVADGLQSKMRVKSGHESVPCSGNADVSLKKDQKHSYSALADSFDEARQQLNSIITYWKDAVGPEQDSSFGRSNQAHMIVQTDEQQDSDVDEEEEEEDQEEDDQVSSMAQTST
ncbi:hypothetical protein MYAM1_003130 [Malassezia yamatoensis]|uniref:Uncharacterized protein n=1 Tax=Malassezia yamatoensis TaxID=253288 RepID=A0AAJ5YV85_9BASI|nr:hypothetical protein MYAM1_003130 [Malassezia yamatoensis]